MAIQDTLTKRMAAAKQVEAPDPLLAGPISSKVRNQMLHVFRSATRPLSRDHGHAAMIGVRKEWDAERGVLDQYLGARSANNLLDHTAKEFQAAGQDESRDFIEFMCIYINTTMRRGLSSGSSTFFIDKALEDFNARLREARLAYRFEPQLNQLVNIGTEQTHEAIVRPALNLLAQAGFEVALSEFGKAFDHLGGGSWKDSITAAGRAFEATMKAICTARGWAFEAEAPAGRLVTVCMNNGLLPRELSKNVEAYVAMLKAGVPEVRNEAGAHGSAPHDEPATETLARYAINQSAASVLLLLERHRDLPRGS